MTIEIKCKILEAFEIKSGQGKEKAWSKMPVLVQTIEQYPVKLIIEVWNDKVDVINNSQIKLCKISANIESKEFNGKYYTSLKLWKIEFEKPDRIEKPEDNDLNNGDDLPF